MRLSNVLETPTAEDASNGAGARLVRAEHRNGNSLGADVAADLHQEALEQIARDDLVREEVRGEMEEDISLPVADDPRMTDRSGLSAADDRSSAIDMNPPPATDRLRRNGKPTRRSRIRHLVEVGKNQKTTRLLLQIWQSDFSIVGFVLAMASFYLMKDTRYGPVGVLFFMLGMAEIDAILSIFVVRLSFHQNKHGFYRTEDFERDWLRYRMLLSMTKVALLFIVATSCGTAAVIACYILWFFTSTLRLRYIILRWSMDDHYPDLQRWSIFALLREAGIEPKLKNFNLMAALGVVLGFGIAFLF